MKVDWGVQAFAKNRKNREREKKKRLKHQRTQLYMYRNTFSLNSASLFRQNSSRYLFDCIAFPCLALHTHTRRKMHIYTSSHFHVLSISHVSYIWYHRLPFNTYISVLPVLCYLTFLLLIRVMFIYFIYDFHSWYEFRTTSRPLRYKANFSK